MAISDTGRSLARPLEVVPSEQLTEYLRLLLAEEGVSEIVVGVPKSLSGEVGYQAERVLAMLRVLRDAFPAVCFVEWDERFTTRLVRSSGNRSKGGTRSRGRVDRRKEKAKGRVDHHAAAAILQEYLCRRETI